MWFTKILKSVLALLEHYMFKRNSVHFNFSFCLFKEVLKTILDNLILFGMKLIAKTHTTFTVAGLRCIVCGPGDPCNPAPCPENADRCATIKVNGRFFLLWDSQSVHANSNICYSLSFCCYTWKMSRPKAASSALDAQAPLTAVRGICATVPLPLVPVSFLCWCPRPSLQCFSEALQNTQLFFTAKNITWGRWGVAKKKNEFTVVTLIQYRIKANDSP